MIWWIHHCTLTVIGKKTWQCRASQLNNKGEYLKVLTDDLHNAEAERVHFSSKWAPRSKGLQSDWHQTCYSLTKEKGTVALSVKWVRLFPASFTFVTFTVIDNTGKMKSDLGSLAACFTFVTFTIKQNRETSQSDF